MSETATKKQKIENLENLEKLENSNQNSNENENYSPLFSLFSYDWFLIEIGRLLINSNDDNDLISILLLNNEINKKATIVFRKHFLNFELQKEVNQLLKKRKLDQIQSIFERESLALNPNTLFFIYFKGSDIPKCVHDPKIKPHLGLPNCECSDGIDDVHLSIVSSRDSKFDSLTKSIIFHPRMKFSSLVHSELISELLQWTIVKNDLNAFELILPSFSSINFSNDIEHWRIPILCCVVYSRTEFLEKFLQTCSQFKRQGLNNFPFEQFFNFEALIKYGGGFKYFEMILNSHYFPFQAKHLLKACEFGFEWVEEMVRYAFKNHFESQIEWVNNSEVDQIMKQLLEASFSKGDKESAKTVLMFAFFIGKDGEFKQFLDSHKWEDKDLLELLKRKVDWHFLSSDKRTMGMILNRLSENAKIYEQDVGDLIKTFLFMNRYDHFELIWNDKHVVHTEEWAHIVLSKNIDNLESRLLSMVISKCNLSAPTESNFEKVVVKSEFRNICLLTALSKHYTITATFNDIQNLLQIKWSEELLDWALKVVDTHSGTSFLVKNSLIHASFWNQTRFHTILLKCCKRWRTESLDILLQSFPKFDCSSNNNEALRKLLSYNPNQDDSDDEEYDISDIVYPVFAKLEPRIRIKNEKERKELMDLAKKKGFTSKKILDAIAKLKLK